MLGQALPGHVSPGRAGPAVVAVRIDADAAAGQEFPPYFDIFRVHGLDEVVHDDVDAVFMEITVIAEAEQIEFQRFTFYHALTRDVGNVNRRIVRLARHGAETGEFGTVKLDEIIPVWKHAAPAPGHWQGR